MNTSGLNIMLVFFICYCATISSCQTPKEIAIDKSQKQQNYILKGDFKFVEYDNLGHVYLVSKQNEILQLKEGKVLFRYSNKRLGEIYKIDARNPQKILVYFGDYYQIVFLDNTLSEIKRLDLEALDFWNIQGVAMSRDNQIWVYDPTTIRLLKINENGKVQLSSNELFNYGFTDQFAPDILVNDQRVYLYDAEGLKVFDEFGVWQNNIDLDNEGLQSGKGYLIVKQDKVLYRYSTKVDFKDPLVKICDLDPGVKDFILLKDQLLVTDNSGLYVIKL